MFLSRTLHYAPNLFFCDTVPLSNQGAANCNTSGGRLRLNTCRTMNPWRAQDIQRYGPSQLQVQPRGRQVTLDCGSGWGLPGSDLRKNLIQIRISPPHSE